MYKWQRSSCSCAQYSGSGVELSDNRHRGLLKPKVKNKQGCQNKDIGREQQIKKKKGLHTHKLGFHYVLKAMDEELLQITFGAVTDHKGHSICVKATYITYVHLAGTDILLSLTSVFYATHTELTHTAGARSIHLTGQRSILPVMASPTTSWQESG